MKKLLIILLVVTGFCPATKNAQSPPEYSGMEIRTTLCRLDKGDYTGAQNSLNEILRQDPQNIYARRLLPGVLAQQVVKDDLAPENIARIRKAIDAYDRYLSNPQIQPAEKLQGLREIRGLIGEMGAEEKTSELLKRAADDSLSRPERRDFYIELAYQSNNCAFSIIEDKASLTRPEIDKAAACVSKGLKYLNKAAAPDAGNPSILSYQASLNHWAVKLAGLTHDRAQQARSQKAYDEARIKYETLVKTERQERDKKYQAERARQAAVDTDTDKRKFYTQELIHYKFENPLDEVVKEIYVPPGELVTPLPADDPSLDGEQGAWKEPPPNTDDQKHEGKSVTTIDGELTMELPDNVRTDMGRGSYSYAAGSENVIYNIYVSPKEPGQTKESDEAALNELTWSFVMLTKNLGSRPDTVFQADFLREVNFGSHPGKLYSLSLGVGDCKTERVLLVLNGRKSNYSFGISRANEQDERVRHFLESIRFN